MSEALHAPQIDNCIRWLWHSCDAGSMVQPNYSEQTRADLDRLFSMLRLLKPTGENGVREFWLHAPRGSLADYGDYEEYLEDGAVDSEEEFEALWRADYPQETVWYHFAATEDATYGFRMVSVGRRLVFIEQESREKGFPLDGTELSGWLVQAVAEVLQQVKAGVYNVFVEENLPAEHRVGTISRAAYWQIWPEEKESFFATLSPAEIEDCLQHAQETGEALPGRLAQLTANDFFRFCALGYQANGYHGAEKPPKEQYLLHADGRDDGLCEIDGDSPAAFDAWYHHRESRSGHPWEVCRGGNSTHVSLYVMQDEAGYYLVVAGRAYTRTVEAIHFWSALHRAGVPVLLRDAAFLKERLQGTERVGIVPKGVIPAYCQSYFPGEQVESFMNLPAENRAQFAQATRWQRLEPLELL